jgi:HPr kinase/phosphorylase
VSDGEQVLLHASAADVSGAGLLILGPSGSGKSGLLLQMIALGASLTADDQTRIVRDGNTLLAEAPAAIAGMLEARGLGILAGLPALRTRLVLAVDLGRTADARMPQAAHIPVLGVDLPLISGREVPNLAPALLLKLRMIAGQET